MVKRYFSDLILLYLILSGERILNILICWKDMTRIGRYLVRQMM